MNENNYLKRFTRGLRILNEMTFPYRYTGDAAIRKQDKMLSDMLSYAVKHCEYYRKLGVGELKLSEFPVLTKKIIRDNYEDMVSDEIDKFIWWDSYTGGSTGEPLHFPNQACIDLPYQKYLWKRLGYKRGDVIVSMAGMKVEQEDLDRNIYWAVESPKDIPYGRMELSSNYFCDQTAPYYIDKLNSVKPAFIRGYPSFIYDVSAYIIRNGISLDFAPKAIELTAETGFEYQFDAIKQAFKPRKLCLQYGHTECSMFGYTYDDTYEFVMEPLYGYVEILDENGQEVAEGEMGEVVVTSLYNKILPFIRYRTGDQAIRGATIDGKLHLKRLMGRVQDHIVDRNNKNICLSALIFDVHFPALGNIIKWQFEQSVPGIVTMRIIKADTYSDADEKQIREVFGQLGNVDLEFEYVMDIPLSPRGKNSMMIQHIL